MNVLLFPVEKACHRKTHFKRMSWCGIGVRWQLSAYWAGWLCQVKALLYSLLLKAGVLRRPSPLDPRHSEELLISLKQV